MKRQLLYSNPAALIAAIMVLGSGTSAWAQEWDWISKAANDQGAAGFGLAVDGDGEAFVAGSFAKPLQFGDQALGGAQSKGAFLAKYDGEGAFMFAVPALGSDAITGTSVAIDGEDACYLAGSFSGTVDFGGVSLSSAGKSDAFLARYSHDGKLQWAKQVGGTDDDAAASINLDMEGNIYMAGHFSGKAGFGTNSMTSLGGTDAFVAKFDGDGNVLWVRQGGGAMDMMGTKARGVAVDQNDNIYVVGAFSAMTAQFGQETLTSAGGCDMFVVKYDLDGNALWARSGGGTGEDSANALAVDVYGNVYVTGSFEGNASFGTKTLASFGNSDVFLSKYDTDGNLLWAAQAGGAGKDTGTSIALDLRGNPHIAGSFNEGVNGAGTINIDGTILTSAGMSDIFVAKYDSLGHGLWAVSAGGTNANTAAALAIDAQGDCFVSGSFGPGISTFGTVSMTNVSDAANYFLAKVDTAEVGVGPIILTAPQSVTNQTGQTITLTISVTTNEFTTFQWLFNGTNLVDGGRLSGAGTASLTITDVQPGDAGKYSVVVMDLDGDVTSKEATLNVTPGAPPSVTIGTFAGLTINGKAGQTFTIKYASELASPVQWTALTKITLTNDTQVWIDTEEVKGKRFYSVEP